MNTFRLGDKVRTSLGNVADIVGITVLYTLSDGSVFNSELLSLEERTYTDEAIVEELCKTLDTSRKVLQTSRRYREIVNKRQAIMYVLRKRFGWTHSYIGKQFKKDHSTTTHSVYVVSDLLEIKDKLFVDMVNKLNDTADNILIGK